MDVVFSVHSHTADEAAVVLHQAGVISILNSTRESDEDAEVGKYKSNLLIRFQNLSYDVRSEITIIRSEILVTFLEIFYNVFI